MEAISAAVSAGVDWVQVRERDLEALALLDWAEDAARAARRAAATTGRPLKLLVNRRCDVAMAIGADGVHLGFDAVDAATARELLGPDALIGVSCHSAEEVRSAPGASYAHLAPIFDPLSKPAERAALGVEALSKATGAIPVLAQGGITPERTAAAVAAGAAGVAVTGAILQADDAGAAAAALRAALDAGAAS